MTDQLPMRRVAFLDTNTLHYAGIYLYFAKEHGLFPLAIKELENEKDTAAKSIDEFAEADLRKGLKQGLAIVHFLTTQDVEVKYAPVSELELLNGRTKGKALISAAKEGVPDRMWSHFHESEIRDRVTLTECSDIKAAIDGLTWTLTESGIAVETRDQNRTSEAMELAKGINGLIYIQAMDSLIYASAIVAQADYLITSDHYLKDTINFIHDPNGEPRYDDIRRQLKQLVSRIILGNAEELLLPSAHTISEKGNPRPQLSVPGSS